MYLAKYSMPSMHLKSFYLLFCWVCHILKAVKMLCFCTNVSSTANCNSSCTKLTKDFHIANALIPQIQLCIFSLGEFCSCCWVS